LGIGPATLLRWQKLPEFQAAYRQARRDAYAQSIARMQQAASAAVSTLLKIMIDSNAPASTRVRAADTRSFGESTYGAATSTFPYKLSDGAQLFLVTGVMLDRNGKEYPDGATPDQVILSATTIATNDPVIRAASEWLLGLRACQASGK
jgi:hypothetical protein